MRIFLNIWSIASKIYRYCINISFQNINYISHINSTKWLWIEILQVKFEYIAINILNWEWIIVLSFNDMTEMLKNGVVNSISSSNWIFVNIKLIENVFLVSSNSWRKNTPFFAWYNRLTKYIKFILKYMKSHSAIFRSMSILYSHLSNINWLILRMINTNSYIDIKESYLSRSELFQWRKSRWINLFYIKIIIKMKLYYFCFFNELIIWYTICKW